MAEQREVLIKVDIDRKGADTGLGSIKTKGDQATKSLKNTQTQAKDTSKSLTGLAADTKIFGVSVNSLSAGFTSMRAVVGKTIATLKIFKTALISTGVGALIIAVGALIVFLTRLQSGMDIVSKAMAQLGAVVDVILDRLANLGRVITSFGSAVIKALKGNFVGAMEAASVAGEELKEVFVGIGEEIAEDVRLAGELRDAIVELEIAEIAAIVPFATIRKNIAQQLLDSKDINRTARQRLVSVQLAGLLEEKLLNDKIALQEEAVRIQTLEFKRAESDRDEEKILRQEEAKLLQLREASLKKQASIAAQVEKFTKAVAKEDLAAAEQRTVALRDEELEKELNHERALTRPIQELEGIKAINVEKVSINKEFLTEIDRQNEEQADKNEALAVRVAESQKRIAQAKEAALLGFASQGLASQKRLAKAGALFDKALTISQIAIATRQAMINSFESAAKIPVIGPALAPIAAAAAFVFGVAQAAAVAGVQFAKGGKIKSRGAPRTGDRVLIRANPGEVILNESQQSRLGGSDTFRRIGVPGFQGGGIVPPANISPTGVLGSDLDRITRAITKLPAPVVTVEDINTGQDRVKIVEDRAVI